MVRSLISTNLNKANKTKSEQVGGKKLSWKPKFKWLEVPDIDKVPMEFKEYPEPKLKVEEIKQHLKENPHCDWAELTNKGETMLYIRSNRP